ncbi:hypothetical protein IB227_05085 [Stenotrophomonas sp. STM01]|uniref:hypothetical protein n=1 Tax=unclassified Stenotrophomonas TaxID=196198 RepID=UPI0017802EDA|nr:MULTISPECIES: hypothetical protein [unclassified Stenotrophomonas]MBD9535223.1 hypothetical protein [Stenotrophomonas sp. STM01]
MSEFDHGCPEGRGVWRIRIIAFMDVYGKRRQGASQLRERLPDVALIGLMMKKRLSAWPKPLIIRSPARRDHLERWQSG